MQIKSLWFGFYIYIDVHIVRISLLFAVKCNVTTVVIPACVKRVYAIFLQSILNLYLFQPMGQPHKSEAVVFMKHSLLT